MKGCGGGDLNPGRMVHGGGGGRWRGGGNMGGG